VQEKPQIVCKKSKFASEEYALNALKGIQAKSKRKVVPCRAYLCKYCNSWHLTSRPDGFKLQKENEELKQEIVLLTEKIVVLTSTDNKVAKATHKRDEYITTLKHTIFTNKRIIKILKQEKQDLIVRLNAKNGNPE